MNRHVEIRDHQFEMHRFRVRLAVCIGFALLLLLILFSRFFYLQVVRHEYYQTLAEKNRISIVPIVPSRGAIMDRNGVILAHNYSGNTLELTPSKLTDTVENTLSELSKLMEITPKDRKRFKKLLAENRDFQTLMLKNNLTDEEAARFAAQQYRFAGVEIRARLFRDYPLLEKAAHLIGYIGRINESDLDQLEEDEQDGNYRGTDHIGKTGLEQSYEAVLHGITGMEEVEVDSGGRAVRVLKRTPPTQGQTLVLTIDAKLQAIADEAFGNYRGALVAIDPRNGEVLAFVSKPGYDPSLFIDGIDSESWDELNNSPDMPLNNRALRGQYPPGSTIKPFMALAAQFFNTQDPKVRNSAVSISDNGVFTLPSKNHEYRDWKVGGHGSVDMFKSIVVSCDIYYYGLAMELGMERIAHYLTRFGFGKKTGIDLGRKTEDGYDGESSGLVPTPAWKKTRYNQRWYGGDTVSVGIGQGYSLVTPMQLAVATATLANNGIGYQPHLVREIRGARPEDTRRLSYPPNVDLKIDPAHLDLVKRAMVAVTQPGGTAVAASAGASYSIAGKTGTAQVVGVKQGEKYNAGALSERHRDHAWFIAFAPAEQPKIAVAILAENGGHGGGTAGPMARKVFDYYLLGKLPTAALPAIQHPASTVAATSGVPEVVQEEEEHD